MLLEYNIKKSAEQMEILTQRGCKILLTMGVDQRGSISVAHDTSVDKILLVQMLESLLAGMKTNGVKTDLKPHIITG